MPALSPQRLSLLALIAPLFLLYAALGLSGYGTDGDTYLMLRSWDTLLNEGRYLPSRSPGYPVPELLIGAGAYLGGHAASNAFSAAFACLALACFWSLSRAAGASGRAALACTAAVGLNPYWIVAASSSMDYAYAAGFFLAGLRLLQRGFPVWAAAAFAASAASRSTYAALALIAFAGVLLAPGPAFAPGRAVAAGKLPARRRVLAAAGLFVAFTALAYAPVLHAMGGRMFVVYMDGPVAFFGTSGFASATDYAARFAYKNIMLWGPFGFCVVFAAALYPAFSRGRRAAPSEAPGAGAPGAVVAAAWAGFAVVEAFFLRIPVEISYLLPALFFGAFLVARLPRAATAGWILAGLHLLQGVAAFEPARIEREESVAVVRTAAGATLDPGFRRGVVLRDLDRRAPRQAYFLGTYFGERPLRRF